MSKALSALILTFLIYCLPLLVAHELGKMGQQQRFQNNFEINNDGEFMQIQTFSRENILPLLPLLHAWCAKYFIGFPYYYAPPKEQLIHPFDTVYINEKKALVVIAKEGDEVVGIASAVSLGSFYLDYNLGYVFSSELIEQFKKKGFYPDEILYVGYFLMAENHKENREAALEIFDELVTAAKRWGKKQICYIQVLCDESRMHESPEPYGTIIPGFRHSGVEMPDLSWPTLQPDGSMQMQNHDMAFYILDL